MKDLVLSDARPKKLTIVPGGMAEEATGVEEGRVFFKSITLNSWTDEYIEDTLSCQVVTVIDGVEQPGIPIAPRQTVPLGATVAERQKIDEVRLVFDGVVNYRFGVDANVEVAGDPELAEPEHQAERKKINFLQNTLTYNATTAMPDQPANAVSGSSYSHVHVYPFENEPPKVWRLVAEVGAHSDAFNDSVVTLAPGREVYYRLRAAPKDADQFVYDPVFYLELPADVMLFDENDINANLSFQGNAVGLGLKGELIPNPVGTGRLLKIKADDKELLNPSQNSAVIVHCKLKDDVSRGVTINSRGYFGVTDPKTPLDETLSGPIVIKNTFDPENEPILLQDSVNVKIRSSGLLEGELYVQTEFDRGTDIWHRHPEVALALPGGLLTYKFVVRNGGQLPTEKLVLYNVFSHTGDGFIVGGQPRGSSWQPYLTGPVAAPAGATVYYSEYTNHKVSTGGVYSGANDWTTTPYNWQSIKAIKIVFDDDYSLNPGETMTMTVPMYAPVDYNFGNGTKHLAISSLATQFKFNSPSAKTSALEPLKVSVKLTPNEKGEISGTVWDDINKNKKKDSGEYPIGDAELYLYKQDGTPLLDGAPVKTDVNGGYKFTNLDNGDYQLRLKLPAGYSGQLAESENRFTTENAPSGFVINTFTIDNSAEKSRVLTDVNAGIYALPAAISGTVWRSLDNTTQRDANTTEKDTPLPNVPVQLWRLVSGEEREMISSTTTDATGGYHFDTVPTGRYIVVFESLENHTFVERMPAPDTPGSPGKANFSQAVPPAETQTGGLVDGQSYEIWLAPGTAQSGIDAGLYPERGSVSGTLWNDTNGNGRNDAGEAGLPGLTVSLFKVSGYGASATTAFATATTNAQGGYLFDNLTPGEYKVVYDGGTERWVSNLKGSAIAEAARKNKDEIAALVIDPAAGDAAVNLTDKNFGLVKKVKISGMVFNDKNANASFQSTIDAKLKSGEIVLKRTSGGDGTAFSNNFSTATGDYTTDALWPGVYTLQFAGPLTALNDAVNDGKTLYDNYLVTTAESGTFKRTTRTHTLTLASGGADLTNRNVAVTRPRTLSGAVWHDVDGNKVKNGSEEWLARTVTLGGPASATQTSATAPGADATIGAPYTYLFEGLYPGTYTVTVTRTGSPVDVVTNAFSTSTTDQLTAAGVYTVVVPALDSGRTNDAKAKNIGLARPVTIEGLVWQDKINPTDYSQDGVYTAGDDLLLKNTAGMATLYKLSGASYVSVATAATDANGKYRFANLLPGDYKVDLTPNAGTYFITGPAKTSVNNPRPENGSAGFTQVNNWITQRGSWSGIRLYSDDDITDMNLSVGRYATISGVLRHDLNGNGIKDSRREGPLAAPPDTVTLRRHDGTAYVPPGAFADADSKETQNGAYSFKVKPGDYTVVYKQGVKKITNDETTPGFTLTVDAADPAKSTATWRVNYNTEQGNYSYAERDFLLSIYASIYGNAWLDKNANAQKDAAEVGKSGAVLTLGYTPPEGPDKNWYTNWFANYLYKTITIDELGSYAFDDLWPGTYTLTLTQAGLDAYTLTSDSADPHVTIGEGKQWVVELDSNADAMANFGLVKPATFAGEVWHDKDASGTNNGEQGIGTVRLVRTDVQGEKLDIDQTVTVQADGRFAFNEILPGTYRMELIGINDYTLQTHLTDGLAASGGAGSAATLTQDAANNKLYTVTITDGTGDGVAVSGADFGFAKASRLQGVVWEDLNNNDVMDAGEELSAHVTAVLKKQLQDDSYDENFTPKKVVTNADGAFDFSDLLPGKYTLHFEHVAASYEATTPNGKTVAAGDAAAVFNRGDISWEITIPTDNKALVQVNTGIVQEGCISGLVWEDKDVSQTKNEDEAGTTGVTVALYKNYGTAGETKLEETQTIAGGTYTFNDVLPGDYTVVITYPDGTWYTTNTGDTVKTNPRTQAVTMVAGGSLKDIDFGLVRPMKISGRVWQDLGPDGGDGIYDPAHDENLNTTVKIKGLSPLGDYQTETDITVTGGVYEIDDLIPGLYQVRMTEYADYALTNQFTNETGPDGDVSFNTADGLRQWKVLRHSGYNQEHIDFAFSQLSVIRGNVWHDLNADGVYKSATEYGLENVVVKISHSTDPLGTFTAIGTATTDADGDYIYPNCQAGYYYKIDVVLPDGGTPWGVTNPAEGLEGALLSNTEKMVYIDRSGRTARADFGLSKYIQLEGRVWTEPDGDGIYSPTNPGDKPVEGHLVTITRYAEGTRPSTFARAAQRVVKGVAPSRFNNLFAAPGQQTKTILTDVNGRFKLGEEDAFFPGDIDIDFDGMPGYLPSGKAGEFPLHRERNGLLSGAEEANINMPFTNARLIDGTVWHDLNADGMKDDAEPWLDGIEVLLSKENDDGVYVPLEGVPPAVTDENGYFKFENLLPGRYRVTAVTGEYMRTNPRTAGDYYDFELDYSFGAEDEVPKDTQIGLVKPATISGRVYDESGKKALAGQKVELYKKDAGGTFVLAATTKTDADGRYTFGKLIRGDYEVRFIIPAGYHQTTGSDGAQSGRAVVIPVSVLEMEHEYAIQTRLIKDIVPGTGKPKPDGKTPGGVQTGDSNHLILWVGVALAAAVVGALLVVRLRRKNQNPDADSGDEA